MAYTCLPCVQYVFGHCIQGQFESFHYMHTHRQTRSLSTVHTTVIQSFFFLTPVATKPICHIDIFTSWHLSSASAATSHLLSHLLWRVTSCSHSLWFYVLHLQHSTASCLTPLHQSTQKTTISQRQKGGSRASFWCNWKPLYAPADKLNITMVCIVLPCLAFLFSIGSDSPIYLFFQKALLQMYSWWRKLTV